MQSTARKGLFNNRLRRIWKNSRRRLRIIPGRFQADPFNPPFSNVQIQPTNVRTRKGYAKNGSGAAVGNTCSPQKILAAVIAKRIAPIMPARRIQLANSLGTLVSRSAADHKAVPAANEGTLSARVAAVPESITPSPIANTRNPVATKSLPFLKNFKASREVATTRPTPSMPHEAARRFCSVTTVPTRPNTPPRARPSAATTFTGLFISRLSYNTLKPVSPRWNPSVTIFRRGGRGPIVRRRSATDADDCKRATALRKHERRLGSPVPGYTDRHEVHGRNYEWSIRADRALDDPTGVGFAIPHPPS